MIQTRAVACGVWVVVQVLLSHLHSPLEAYSHKGSGIEQGKKARGPDVEIGAGSELGYLMLS